MASTSRSKRTIEDDDQEEEFEHFDDFTLASSWERFISEIEAVCRQWLVDGPKNLVKKGATCLDVSKDIYKVKSEFKYALKNYIMEYHFDINKDGKVEDWISTLHDLQQSFGVKNFLVIAPQSASGVVLDAPEASKLLSAVAIALSNCSSLWPAFVPVHDPSRKAYIGIQNMGTIFTRRFEADRIGSQIPIKLMHLEGLYELFVSKFVYSTVDLSMHLFDVSFKMKLSYRTLPTDDDAEVQGSDAEFSESGGNSEFDTRIKIQWDDDCPWSEWYSSEDPVKGFDLLSIWSGRTIESSVDMAELENASPLEADMWFIFPDLSHNLEDSNANTIGFASQLRLLVKAFDSSLEAQFMEDFVSVENSGADNMMSSAVIPPPTVLDRVLKDLFHEAAEQQHFVEGEHKTSRAIKGAPLESVFAQFCLHALWFGNCNIRAIAVLWIEFVREIRWCWEESQPLPRMSTDGTIDLSTCLINQKLQMLAICIDKKHQQNQEYRNVKEDVEVATDMSPLLDVSKGSSRERDSPSSSFGLVSSAVSTSMPNSEHRNASLSTDPVSSEHIRKGSAGIVGSTMLLNSYQHMHAPFTQDSPLMTEDMHEERLQAVEASGDSFSFSAQLEKEILSSDMSAFKAANPAAVFKDFIRWHSPRDWENDDNGRIGGSQTSSVVSLDNEWPPQGRLSERMSENGNSWTKIWNEAPPLPASEQKPLLDPNQEGEKVLHYLETLRPHQLLEQMVCTAFRAAAATLNRTAFGALKPMTTKIDQLYATMASSLKYLQRYNLSADSEIIGDLQRLCVVFEHVEKLLTVAASLHRKFLQAPRLSETIFNDFYKCYLPKMATGSISSNVEKEFSMKYKVMMREREVVAGMFTHPTSNQSWRKVLSMGNLLNGHEPILREIIFSKSDHVSGIYHAASNSGREIETYRMYICGTSNDLRVALAITSCD